MAVLVGKPAPDFTATAVMGNNEIKEITLSSFTKGKYTVIFFYPFDFTFVCPTELIAFDHRLDEFTKRNVQVIGVSIDSEHTHLAWKNTPVDKGGIGPVHYPIVADVRHLIARAYDVESSGGQAYRGSFLVDRDGVVRHQVVNDIPLGRNIDEMIRMVDRASPPTWRPTRKSSSPRPGSSGRRWRERGRRYTCSRDRASAARRIRSFGPRSAGAASPGRALPGSAPPPVMTPRSAVGTPGGS
jgi:peroxiredoxin (alkyl hydroperoxide reductase subunit C)